MDFYQASSFLGVEPWFLFSPHSFSHSTKFIYCLLFVAVNLCPWHGNLKIKMGHSLFFCSRFPGRFARFEFNIITFSFNCTADVLQRDFTIVFEGWPTEKNKKYSEGKKVIKIAKDTKRQHNIKIPWQRIITQHAAEMSLQNWNENNVQSKVLWIISRFYIPESY